MRLAVFASGGGSNLGAILDQQSQGLLDIEIVLVVSNKAGTGALSRAQAKGIPAHVVNPDTDSEEAYLDRLDTLFTSHGVNFIALAGYLKKIPLKLVQIARGRMLNIHPALLPAFGGPGMYGKHIHRAAIDYGVRWSGVTVHLVEAEYDTGPVVLQEPVPVLQGDTPETLAQRILAVEHRLLPEALRLFARGDVSVSGREVYIKDYVPPPLSDLT